MNWQLCVDLFFFTVVAYLGRFLNGTSVRYFMGFVIGLVDQKLTWLVVGYFDCYYIWCFTTSWLIFFEQRIFCVTNYHFFIVTYKIVKIVIRQYKSSKISLCY